MTCEHAIIQPYTYEDFTASRMSDSDIMQINLADDIVEAGGEFWKDTVAPWIEEGFDTWMFGADQAKRAIEYMATEWLNLGFGYSPESSEFNENTQINLSSAVSGSFVYYYRDEYNVTNLEIAKFAFYPASVSTGFVPAQGENLYMQAIVRSADLSSLPWIEYYDNGIGYRSIQFNSGTYYGWDLYINDIFSGYNPHGSFMVDTDFIPTYNSGGGSNTSTTHLGQIKSVTLATDKKLTDAYGGFYIPGGSYNYESYMNTIINNYNQTHPDNSIPDDYIPTFQEAYDTVYPSDNPGGGDGTGDCICNHYYEAGAFSEGAFSANAFADADININAEANAFTNAELTLNANAGAFGAGAFSAGAFGSADIDITLGAGAFGAGALGAGAFADADLHFNGDINIDSHDMNTGGTVTNNYDGATVTNQNTYDGGTINNTYDGAVTNNYDGATLTQNYDGAEITNFYEGAEITQNVTIDGSDIDLSGLLNGEEIEDIHTDIVKEIVSIDDLEQAIENGDDEIAKQLLNFVPDAMKAGFSVLDAWNIEETFENSALIAFLFRIIGGA